MHSHPPEGRLLFLGLLRGVGDGLGQRGEAQQQHMSVTGLGLLEHTVSAVKTVQHPQDSEALVEFQVVEVVELWRGQEG